MALAMPKQRPNYVGLDLRSICESHPGPVKNPTLEWTSGDSAGFRVDKEGTIYRDGEELPLQVTLPLPDYRAFLAAVWEALDKGYFVALPATINVVHDSSEIEQSTSDEEDQRPSAAEKSSLSEDNEGKPAAENEGDVSPEQEVDEILAEAGIDPVPSAEEEPESSPEVSESPQDKQEGEGE